MHDQPTKTEYKPAQARSLRDYVRIVLARKLIVLFIFLASLGATFYYLKTVTPVYQAQVKMMRVEAEALPFTILNIPMQRESIQSQNALLTSTSSLAEIKNRLHAKGYMESPDQQLLGNFSLVSDTENIIIALRATATTPERAQSLANTAAEVYIEKVTETKSAHLNLAITFLGQQMQLVNNQLQQSEQALNEFYKREGIRPQMSSMGITSYVSKLGEMQSELSRTEYERDWVKAQLQSVQALISEKSQVLLSSSLTPSLTPQIDQLQSKLIELQLQLDMMRERLTEKDPEVISVQQQIAALQKRLEAETVQLLKGQTSMDLISEFQSLMQQSISLNVQLRGLELKVALLEQKIVKFEEEEHPEEEMGREGQWTRLARQARVHEQNYMTLLGKYEEMRLLKEMKTSGLKIIDEAALPRSPISPQKKKLLLFGLIGGLVLGVGFAFFLEYIDDSIKLKEDVERYLALPVMGTIPKIPPFKVPENALSRRELSTDSGNGLNGLGSDNPVSMNSPMPAPSEQTDLIVEHPDLPAPQGTSRQAGEDGEDAANQPTGSNLVSPGLQSGEAQSKRRRRHAKGHRKRIKQLLSNIILYAEKKTPILTSYRTLAANIRYANVDTPTQTLLVTSAGPMEGKTSTASNLAISMAQTGSKVLLIDTDLRRPRMHRLFQQDRSPGLTDLLTVADPSTRRDENHLIEEGSRLEEPFIRPTSIDNLYLFPCGAHVSNPEGLLSSEKMKRLIKSLSGQYDIIIFDSPPLISAADAMILATEVDATLMVVHSGKTKRQVALQGKELLENVDAKIIGAVLNNIDYSKQYGSYYYYYYYYRSYYYSSDEEE